MTHPLYNADDLGGLGNLEKMHKQIASLFPNAIS